MVVPREHATGFLVSAIWTVSNVALVRFSALGEKRRGDLVAFRRVVGMPSNSATGLRFRVVWVQAPDWAA